MCFVALIVHWGGVISFSHFMLYLLVLHVFIESLFIALSVYVGVPIDVYIFSFFNKFLFLIYMIYIYMHLGHSTRLGHDL